MADRPRRFPFALLCPGAGACALCCDRLPLSMPDRRWQEESALRCPAGGGYPARIPAFPD
ncbi:MAG: hypothetical protein ACI4WV_05180 [Eubacteriales bacterium]